MSPFAFLLVRTSPGAVATASAATCAEVKLPLRRSSIETFSESANCPTLPATCSATLRPLMLGSDEPIALLALPSMAFWLIA